MAPGCKKLQKLRVLSSVTLSCQVTMIDLNAGSQLSEMSTISHKLMCLSWSLYLLLSFFGQVLIRLCLITAIKCLNGLKALGSLFDGVL